MGIFKKIRDMVNIDDEVENEFEDDIGGEYESTDTTVTRDDNTTISAYSVELKVVRPDSFVNSRQIAEHLLNKRTVVLNLEATNKETARRILDFLSGVAYSIGGQLKRVANNTFVITPNNVDVSGDPMRTPAAEPDTVQMQTMTETTQTQPAQFTGDTLY